MAVAVIRRLRRNGHEALLAGGCVRDMLMGRRPADFDVATSATPDEVARIFHRVIMVGAKFGVAMVIIDQRRIEVATFRTDVSYSDGRRPDSVRFASAREDALRRDFTINGMFFDPLSGQVVDYVGGQEDLQAGVIRAIGDAEIRFSEDYLRMLRAVRFANRFNFPLDEATTRAIKARVEKIHGISGERIREELEKMLSHVSAAKAMEMLHEMGLLQAILPALFERESLWPAARQRMELLAIHRDYVLLMAALLAELPAETIRALARAWGGSNLLKDSLLWLSTHHRHWQRPDMSLAQLKRLMANRDWQRLLVLWKAQERIETGAEVNSLALSRRASRVAPESVAPPALVTGLDLKDLGLPSGPKLGSLLQRLYEAQLDETISTRPQAMELARSLIAGRQAGRRDAENTEMGSNREGNDASPKR